jgi:hypothetical protein
MLRLGIATFRARRGFGDGRVGETDLCIVRADDMRHARSREQERPSAVWRAMGRGGVVRGTFWGVVGSAKHGDVDERRCLPGKDLQDPTTWTAPPLHAHALARGPHAVFQDDGNGKLVLPQLNRLHEEFKRSQIPSCVF